MKTNRILQLIPVAALCLLFTSCVDSKVPLSDPNMSKPDERLAGVWRKWDDVGGGPYYHFARAGDKLPASVMRMASNSHKSDVTTEQSVPLLLFPTTIGDKTYLNVADGREPQTKLVEEKGWTPDTVTAYLIVRYQVTGDVLTMQGIDGDAKKRAIQAGKIKGAIARDSSGAIRVFFTDTTENLAKFITAAGDDLFSKDVLKLERAK